MPASIAASILAVTPPIAKTSPLIDKEPVIAVSCLTGILFNAEITATATATYVPYSGATGAVDLGAQNLTTTGTGTFGQIIDNGLSNENIPPIADAL